ncbi:hypothetical protein ACIA5D_30205 [Actinoplanes sp. NPDC051513]|uniref:hypothetical protein n=1 Tax=Actinoplanes sp. NPDC051513 TaxID=3363908 RepID=UPI0037BCCA9A
MRKVIRTLFTVCAIAVLTPAVASPAQATSPAQAKSAAQATRIVLDREGGFAGLRNSYVVDRWTDGGRRPLRMAGSNAFLRLRGSYQPANPCCDLFAYRLTVTYRGGWQKVVSTVQGTAAPSILWDVIADVQRVGVDNGAISQ